MAVAYASVSVENPSSTTTTNLALPSGTAAGDLLLLILDWFGHQDEDYDITAFTEIFSRTSAFSRPNLSYYYTKAGYKVADATDISNGYIQISSGAGYSSNAKSTLIRITGAAASSIQADNTSAAASSTPSYGFTITPAYANSLIIYRVFGSPYNSSSMTVSTYAIPTDNPSWTEITDTSFGPSDYGTSATAYANRSQTTATGNPSCALSLSKVSNGMMFVIPPAINGTASPVVASAVFSAPTITATGTATASPTAGVAVFSAPTITALAPLPDWTNISKGASPTWTNQSKS